MVRKDTDSWMHYVVYLSLLEFNFVNVYTLCAFMFYFFVSKIKYFTCMELFKLLLLLSLEQLTIDVKIGLIIIRA